MLSLKICKRYSLYLLLFVFSINAECQRNISPQAQKAIELFKSERYTEALTEFQKLLSQFPKDQLYQYYLGATLVELNASPEQAIECLKNATASNKYTEASYYLGIAYYRQFQFDEARSAFEECQKKFSSKEYKTFKIADELKRVETAKIFFKKGIKLEVLYKRPIPADSIFSALNDTIPIKFNFQDYFNLTDKIISKSFKNILPGEYYYFSAQNGNKGKDIYRIKKLNDEKWSKPENLGKIINSNYDEDFPFFDYSLNFLYFASKGHGSVGGYDIFRSQFDTVKNAWSQPQQLPFPINSPWDDYLFIENANKAYFVSDRENFKNLVEIYSIVLPDFNKEHYLDLNSDIYNTCMIKENKTIYEMKNHEINNSQNAISETQKISNDLAYFITKALIIQHSCDSLILMNKKFKSLLIITEDKEKRASIFSDIARNEKLVVQYQSEANSIFDNVKEIQNNKKPNIIENSIRSNHRDTLKFVANDSLKYPAYKPMRNDSDFFKGVFYRIQIGAFSKPVSQDYFKGLNPISNESFENGKIIKYYLGIFNRFNKADILLKKVKVLGFNEAFIVAYYNDRKIPLERAKELEKENQ